MQYTIVICLRYMMIAIGAATPSELNVHTSIPKKRGVVFRRFSVK